MQYLTKDEIKKQLVIDADYHGDDEFLEMLGDAAEDMTSQLLNVSLDQLAACNGAIPASIRHAMRMLVDYLYSVDRGSSEAAPDIPNAVRTMIKLYRSYN